MIRRDAQWVHAGKVALGATVVVAAVTVVVALVANLLILDRLDHSVDLRLSSQLATAAKGPVHSLPAVPVISHTGDFDDAPTFAWAIGPTGRVTPLTVGAPRLPHHRWTTDQVTLSTAGTTFRFDAERSATGWLIAGESVVKIGQARSDLLLAEALLGALLLLVTFGGAFIIGLRASAPIEQIRRRQSEFTADASHELRTPLSVIEAEVDLALSRPRDVTSYQATLRRISSESGRLRSIVEDLLWLARADGGPPRGRSGQTTEVAVVGATCVARLGPVADAATVSLRDRSRPGVSGRIAADPDSVDRLITVLLDNACRYSVAGGTVELEVTDAGSQVVLTVDDSGLGIPEDHRDLVFDRFHRASDQPGGTGLGLAIADAVVRNSAGSWSIGTSPMGGARMQVTWHRTSQTREVPGDPHRAAAGIDDHRAATGTRTPSSS
jgi:signal transduction histidine kinase